MLRLSIHCDKINFYVNVWFLIFGFKNKSNGLKINPMD